MHKASTCEDGTFEKSVINCLTTDFSNNVEKIGFKYLFSGDIGKNVNGVLDKINFVRQTRIKTR